MEKEKNELQTKLQELEGEVVKAKEDSQMKSEEIEKLKNSAQGINEKVSSTL
jgi:hypothetical protein